MKVKSESEVAELCLTLGDPMDCGLPGFSVHGALQARVLEWGAIAFSKNIKEGIQSLSCCHKVVGSLVAVSSSKYPMVLKKTKYIIIIPIFQVSLQK